MRLISERFSKADLRHIAESLIEDLRECEDGTDITTWQLVKAAGYDMDDFQEWDLFDVHDALFKAAKANRITLDMSAHEGKVEGLPFNLDFIVRNKKAQIKYPRCGSINTARYIYGYPLFDEEMQKKLDEGKWVLGGCCISSVEIDVAVVGVGVIQAGDIAVACQLDLGFFIESQLDGLGTVIAIDSARIGRAGFHSHVEGGNRVDDDVSRRFLFGHGQGDIPAVGTG